MAMEQRQRRRPLTRQEQLALQERKQRRREKMEESRELARGPIDVTFCLLVLLLTAAGYTSMWMGVFADVGVMVLAVLNATRALRTAKGPAQAE